MQRERMHVRHLPTSQGLSRDEARMRVRVCVGWQRSPSYLSVMRY